MPLERGLIQVYSGLGKGETTAALGLALRAAGQGLKVYIIQFMKGWPDYGELVSVRKLPNITLRQFGRPEFVDKDNPHPEDIRQAHDALDHARQIIQRIFLLEARQYCPFFILSGIAQLDSQQKTVKLRLR